jgi:leucyl-tRNA synthetase
VDCDTVLANEQVKNNRYWRRLFATSDVDYYRWNQQMFLMLNERGLVEHKMAPVNWCVDCDTVLANEQVKNNRYWRRLFATSDVDYYRWNQQMFLMLNERGLVEHKMAPVNWCVDCDTVLANEQVKNNRYWRRLFATSDVDYYRWNQQMFLMLNERGLVEHKMAPVNWCVDCDTVWIGRSHGTHIDFPVVGSEASIGTFTTRPDTIFGVNVPMLASEPTTGKSM